MDSCYQSDLARPCYMYHDECCVLHAWQRPPGRRGEGTRFYLLVLTPARQQVTRQRTRHPATPDAKHFASSHRPGGEMIPWTRSEWNLGVIWWCNLASLGGRSDSCAQARKRSSGTTAGHQHHQSEALRRRRLRCLSASWAC